MDKTASLHVFSDVRRDIRKALHVGGAKATAAAVATTTTESGDDSGGSSAREGSAGSGGRGNGEHGNTNATNEIGVASGGGVSAKYAVELTRATLDMHLFGPFMGFLYERTFFACSGIFFYVHTITTRDTIQSFREMRVWRDMHAHTVVHVYSAIHKKST